MAPKGIMRGREVGEDGEAGVNNKMMSIATAVEPIIIGLYSNRLNSMVMPVEPVVMGR